MSLLLDSPQECSCVGCTTTRNEVTLCEVLRPSNNASTVEWSTGRCARSCSSVQCYRWSAVLGAWLHGDAEECRRRVGGSSGGAHRCHRGVRSGKTTAIKQLVTASLLGDGLRQRVVWLDGKEDNETDLSLLVRSSPGDSTTGSEAVADERTDGPLARTGQELADRFHALADWSEPYYEAVARAAAKLSIEDPRGLPRSLDDILARMESTAMKVSWAGTPNAEVAGKLSAELLEASGFATTLSQRRYATSERYPRDQAVGLSKMPPWCTVRCQHPPHLS